MRLDQLGGQLRIVEQQLGTRLGQIDRLVLDQFVANKVPESDVVDFKGEIGPGTESSKQELAKDVAAFANHLGGLLIIGMSEEKDAGTGDRLLGS